MTPISLPSLGTWQPADQNRGNPLLSEDQLQEAVPGSIRKNEHFVAFLKKIVVYYKTLLDGQEVNVETALSFLMKQGNGQVRPLFFLSVSLCPFLPLLLPSRGLYSLLSLLSFYPLIIII